MSESPYAEYNGKLKQIMEILNKGKKNITNNEVDVVVNNTMDILRGLASMNSKSGKIRDDVEFTKDEQFEIAKKYLDYVKKQLTTVNNNYELIQNAYNYTLKGNPFGIWQNDKRGDIFAHISNQILLSAASKNKDLKPSISESIEKRNKRSNEKAILNSYNDLLEEEEQKRTRKENEDIKKENEEVKKALAENQNKISELIKRKDLSDKEKEEQIDKLIEERNRLEKGVKIAKEGFNYVVGGIKDIKDNSKIQNTVLGELLKKNKSDILNDVALRYAGDPDLKKNIRKIKGDIKAANPSYSDGDINYIISKALSENDRYLKTVAANPDLFERDMSQDTIQKENEQFQSKLRQQNLRYILPKFIERREKLVENTLNPELLKGAFAI